LASFQRAPRITRQNASEIRDPGLVPLPQIPPFADVGAARAHESALPRRHDATFPTPDSAGRLTHDNLGISEGNDYGLLEEVGGDVAGAINLRPDGVDPTPRTRLGQAPQSSVRRSTPDPGLNASSGDFLDLTPSNSPIDAARRSRARSSKRARRPRLGQAP